MSGAPLAPTDRQWAEALASLSGTATPERVDAALRDVLRVPAPRDPLEDDPETCWRCKGSREIPAGNDPLGRDLYDPCPECDPEA